MHSGELAGVAAIGSRHGLAGRRAGLQGAEIVELGLFQGGGEIG